MKQLCLLLTLLFFAPLAFGDSITLTNPDPVSPAEATKFRDWKVVLIDPAEKILKISYKKVAADGSVLLENNNPSGVRTWTCENTFRGDNQACVGVDDPWDCCTAPGLGTCPEADSTCFSDVFNYSINCPTDDGKSIGIGLRTLIWNQMKADVIPGNDGTFDP